MSSFEIVAYHSGLKGAVVDLWRSAFPMLASYGRDHLEWKYERNPYLHEPILYIALDEQGSAIGMRGFYGTRWRSSVGNVTIPCADDFAIAHAHRNTGLARALMRVALDDLEQKGWDYVMNASGGQATVVHSLAMGWKSVSSAEPVARYAWNRRGYYVVHDQMMRWAARPSNPRRLHSRAYNRIYNTVSRARDESATSFDRLDRIGGRVTGSGGEIVVESSPRAEAMADLAERLPADGRIRHVRDREFFEWRFENPTRDYRFVFYERDGRTDGYLIVTRYRAYRPPTLPFHISDWEGASPDAREALLDFIVRDGGLDRLGAWTGSLATGHKLLLQQAGFRRAQPHLRTRGMPCVLVRKLGEAGEWCIGGSRVVDASSWDIRLIDSMHG